MIGTKAPGGDIDILAKNFRSGGSEWRIDIALLMNSWQKTVLNNCLKITISLQICLLKYQDP